MDPSLGPSAEWAIEGAGLVKRFGEVLALNGVDLQVARGDVFGLVGPDGAGKTTLMRVLSGLLTPEEGSARVAGCDVVASPESAKPHLGYLAQRFGLWGDLTIDENLRFCADLYRVRRADYEARRPELLSITRLAPFTNRRADHLSGGMRQKLGLICTLIHRPEVLLLDEPTTGVDPASRRDFWRLLYDLPRQGVTVLVSTPYMDEAERCDRVALLHEGRVLACASPEALKERVPGRLFAVDATPQRTAKELLLAADGVQSVVTFGDRLHVSVGDDVGPERIEARLREGGVEVASVAPIMPGLEDVFTTVVGGGGGVDV
ncbi:MAG: ABC transporter ATP-binding protein [Armatimonadetes bacterium]|nr:ABC transporter ATP-binding protein [Armatimonadota bacterium]